LGLLTEKNSKVNAISKIALNPSVLKSFVVKEKKPIIKIKEIQNFISNFNSKFDSNSYLNIRYSGTENKIRILIQGVNLKRINAQIKIFESIIEDLNDKA
jgi:phosphoglucosamine mutase